MTIEQEFAAFVESLRDQGHKNLQQALSRLEAADVSEEYQRSFGFWQSLSGASRNFMLDVACGRRTRKRHSGAERGRLPLKPHD